MAKKLPVVYGQLLDLMGKPYTRRSAQARNLCPLNGLVTPYCVGVKAKTGNEEAGGLPATQDHPYCRFGCTVSEAFSL